MLYQDRPIPLRELPDRNGVPKTEGPRPLMRELPPADPFPVDALGDVLGAATLAIHDRVRAPLAIGAQSVLAAATLAVQGHTNVVFPIGNGVARSVSNYFVTVGVSGERKSASDDQAMWPIHRFEKTLREKYDFELPDYLDDKLAWEKARDHITKKGRSDRATMKAQLGALGPAPIAPLQPLLTFSEPTFEGLTKLFASGQPSLGLFSTEGGQFIGGHGMKDENKLKTAAGLSDLWDGKPIRRVRAGDGVSILPGRRLSMHIMVQPEVANLLLDDDLLCGQGLLTRMLVTAPDSAIGSRQHRAEQSNTDHDLKRYGARLLAILELPLPLAEGKNNELEPKARSLTTEARDCLIRFHDHVENKMRAGGDLEPVRGLGNKLAEHAARLATVLSAVSDIERPTVEIEEIRAGVALADHYVTEALRLAAASHVGNDLRPAQKLLNWLLDQWTECAISLPDIYQRGPNAIRDKATPSQRFRWEQYIRQLAASDIHLTPSPFLHDADMDLVHGRGEWGAKAALLVRGARRRLRDVRAARSYDLVLVHRESFPVGPAWVERLLQRCGVPYVFDFDDAIYLPAASDPNRRLAWLKRAGKAKRIVRGASLVIAGNQHLAGWAREYARNVTVIPTTIDTGVYRTRERGTPERVCVGWSGSPTTIVHLRLLEPVLRVLHRERGIRILVIGDGSYRIDGAEVESLDWRAASEVDDLSRIDIGVMPMPDDEWSRGKCGLKALQYMALGIPAVLSPVGVNREIAAGGAAILASTEDEWLAALRALIDDERLRNRVGEAGRARVRQRYSVAAVAPSWERALREAAGMPAKPEIELEMAK